MFKFSTTLLFLLVLVLPILAKEAQYGNYTFTFFVEENCKGEINGEPMTGEVGDGAYCMNFTQGVLSMRADFANLTDKHGDAIDGGFYYLLPSSILFVPNISKACGLTCVCGRLGYIIGVGLMYRTQKDMECGIKKNGIPAIGFYGTSTCC